MLASLAAGAASLALPAWAAGPSKSIKLVVTSAPGSTADLLARLIADHMAKPLGQALAIENRPGPGGTAGALAVAQAAPDATTLLLGNSMALGIAPFAADKPPYDPIDSFTHLAMLGTTPLVLVAHPRTGITTLAELEARVRKEGRMGFLSAGAGSLGHVYGELMKGALGLNLVHVTPREGAAAELLAGSVPLGIDLLTPYLPHFASGRLVPLAVTSAERSALAPDVPSVADFGHRKLVLENFFGLSAPGKLPAGHVARLAAACTQALGQAEVQRKMLELGVSPQPLNASAYTAHVKNQASLLAPAVKSAGIRF